MSDMRASIKDPAEAKRFMLAGNATVTFLSTPTGNRFTFKVRKVKERRDNGPTHFVDAMIGSDNEQSFTFLGMITADGAFKHLLKSRLGPRSPATIAFGKAWNFIGAELPPPEWLEVWHEGRCGACGRKLTVPDSIKTGFGPECAGKSGIQKMKEDFAQ